MDWELDFELDLGADLGARMGLGSLQKKFRSAMGWKRSDRGTVAGRGGEAGGRGKGREE